MLTEDRYETIYHILEEKNTATIGYLKKSMYVSETTIRRDLTEMEKRGIVKRVWGGVMLLKCPDSPGFVRLNVNKKEKEAIAKTAVSFVHDSSSIFIDSSSTCVYLARELKNFKNLTIITNSIDILNTLKYFSGVTVYLTGGILTENYDMTGKLTLDGIKQFYTDYSFISCSGITVEQGIMGKDMARLPIQQEMLRNSGTKILLCDSGKAGRKSLLSVASLDNISYVIMDKLPDDKELIAKLGDKLITSDGYGTRPFKI
jgi:DeoR family fructose operon transcriptional repressor